MKLPKPLPYYLRFILMMLLVFYQSNAFSQENITPISGRIISEDGEPLPGVNILITGTTIGTITDTDGNYEIGVPEGYSIITVSYVGYLSQVIDIKGKTVIDITMEPEISELEEIVVVGYSEQKKETLTGSISQIKGKDLVLSPQPNVSSSLAGRFSGLIANNRAGEPGYDDSQYYIRGLATTGNNDVLVVVDGIPEQLGGLNRLNPNDIQSISILKDASAAIYGSRSANGVILITTKKGVQGKPTIDYSFNIGLSSPTRLPKMADAVTFATIQNEIAYYRNPNGGMNQFYDEEEIQMFADGSDPINYPNTDWAESTLKKSSLQHQHNLAISGGTEKIKYYISIGKLFQDGLYKDGATKYDQYSFRSNITSQVTKNLDVSLMLSGRQENRIFPAYSAGHIFRSIYRAYPIVIDKYPNGYPSTGVEGDNPVVMVTDIGGTNKNPKSVFNGILKASYNIPFLKGLSIDGFFGVDKNWNFTKAFSIPYSLYSYNSNNDTYNESIFGGSAGAPKLYEWHENESLVTANYKLNFVRQLGEHDINAFIGYEQSKNTKETFDATRLNYPTPETPELSQGGPADADILNSGSSFLYTRRSYLGRMAYNYKEKYLVEVQLRIDGSSTFPRGNRYGTFPGFSAGWRISEENWMESLSFINDLKIRVSYGQLGNDNVDQFQYFNNYTFNSEYIIGGERYTGIDISKMGNAGITWETAEKTDFGLNTLLFNMISLEAIYFQQKRSDILAERNASIPTVSGIVNRYENPGETNPKPIVPSENIGKVDSKGFEATLGVRKHYGDFWYNVSGNMTFAKNKIVFVDEPPLPDSLAHQMETGGPLNTYLLYNVTGIFRTNADLENYIHLPNAQLGDLIYEDYDGDGEITEGDKVRSKYGNIPELTYGFNINVGWKIIDLSVLLAGQSRVSQYVLSESGTIGNFYSSWADNRWSPSNPDGSYPRVDTRASSSINGGQFQNNFWLNDASFLRVKNVALSITIPDKLTAKAGISSLRFNINAFNLFTFTKVKDYDPEGDSESAQFYPQQKIISFGVNVQL
jgi:TonB-linked SusC/RagA family outer membrane protein